MAVKAELVPEGVTVEVEVEARGGGVRVRDLVNALRRMGRLAGDVVVVFEGRPLPEDAVIPDGSTVTVLRVLSGGDT